MIPQAHVISTKIVHGEKLTKLGESTTVTRPSVDELGQLTVSDNGHSQQRSAKCEGAHMRAWEQARLGVRARRIGHQSCNKHTVWQREVVGEVHQARSVAQLRLRQPWVNTEPLRVYPAVSRVREGVSKNARRSVRSATRACAVTTRRRNYSLSNEWANGCKAKF